MRPVGERHLDHELGFHPVPVLAGALVGQVVEGTVLARELLRRARATRRARRASKPPPTRPTYFSALAGLHADQQRGKRAGAAPGQIGGAADHELLLAVALDLEPVRRSGRRRRRESIFLATSPSRCWLQTRASSSALSLWIWSASRSGPLAGSLAKAASSRALRSRQRQGAQVLAVVVQQVEDAELQFVEAPLFEVCCSSEKSERPFGSVTISSPSTQAPSSLSFASASTTGPPCASSRCHCARCSARRRHRSGTAGARRRT